MEESGSIKPESPESSQIGLDTKSSQSASLDTHSVQPQGHPQETQETKEQRAKEQRTKEQSQQPGRTEDGRTKDRIEESKQFSEQLSEPQQRNYWMYISVFLGVVLVFTLFQNYQTNKFVMNAITGNIPGAPSLAPQPSPSPSLPSPSPSAAPSPSPQPVPQPPARFTGELEDDDPYLGDENAPVVMVEFSDFQCPFCRRFWRDTLPQIKSQYVDTGKVKYVYRDFPLSFHPAAQPSAEAAECADEQGKFWELHDKLFEEQDKSGQGTVQFTLDDIKEWASSIDGLDYEKWNECVDSGTYRSEIQKDFSDGSAAGVSGTPGFLINGIEVSGAQPFQVFQQVIESELNN